MSNVLKILWDSVQKTCYMRTSGHCARDLYPSYKSLKGQCPTESKQNMIVQISMFQKVPKSCLGRALVCTGLGLYVK